MNDVSDATSMLESVRKVQSFDMRNLPGDCAEGALCLIGIYKRIPDDIETVKQLPDRDLKVIQDRANEDWNLLSLIEGRLAHPCVQKLNTACKDAFDLLHPYISYLSGITLNPQKANDIIRQMNSKLDEAKDLTEKFRKLAEEIGVSKQARYFQAEARGHSKAATCWLICTAISVGVLLGYTGGLLYLWDHFYASTSYMTAQLVLAKILVFTTLSFGVYMSAKNYFARQHNAVVNKHRQNALCTYEVIVEAAGEQANRDIILAKAADCIFTAQPTAFSKFEASENTIPPWVNAIAEKVSKE